MLKTRIIETIQSVLNSNCGFDIYVAMKNDNVLIKRFVLEEGDPIGGNSFKRKIRNTIETTINNRFLSEDSQYADGYTLSDNQNCFYVIRQNENYQPFQYLNIPDEEISSFRLTDKNKADALLFKYTVQRNGEVKILWAYQKIHPSSIPNKKRITFN